ncbi:MAG: MFS transporter [Gammaproteobacteria bacterium]|jgi:MFS family permease|nr:MFS transporter [Gammaproteobacteria bacterium]
MSDAHAKPLYYGWKIVAAILFTLTFSSGLSFYNHSIYLNALAATPAFTVQTASVAVSLFFFSGGLAGLWVARWVQHYDPRYCLSAGAIVSAAALSTLPFVKTVPQLYAVYCVFGVGFSASSLIPATTIVARWFKRRRAMALSIASTGLSLGGVILTPVCVLLVERLGFEVAAPIMGLIYVVGVIPAAWIWLRASPEAMGLRIDGDAEIEAPEEKGDSARIELSDEKPSAAAQGHFEDGLSFREARGTRFFWGIAPAYIFLLMAQVGGIAHQFGLARETLSESQTALAVAILPVMSIIGRLLGGWVVGKVPIRRFALFIMLLQILALALLSLGAGPIALCFGLGLFGCTVGNLLMLQPLLIAEAFGLREYARIFSVANLMSSWGTAAGPAVMGYVFALNDNQYGGAYLFAAAAAAVGFALFASGGPLLKPEQNR